MNSAIRPSVRPARAINRPLAAGIAVTVFVATICGSSIEACAQSAGSPRFIDGTIVRYDPAPGQKELTSGNGNLLVIRDAEGKEHSFATYKGDISVRAYDYVSDSAKTNIGKRVRVFWEPGADRHAGRNLKMALEIYESDVRKPAKGSAERKAIIEAVRAAYQQRFKKRPTLDPDEIRNENGWSCFSGTANEPGGKKTSWFVVLRGSGTQWQVVDADSENLALLERLLREHPATPASLRVMLDFY